MQPVNHHSTNQSRGSSSVAISYSLPIPASTARGGRVYIHSAHASIHEHCILYLTTILWCIIIIACVPACHITALHSYRGAKVTPFVHFILYTTTTSTVLCECSKTLCLCIITYSLQQQFVKLHQLRRRFVKSLVSKI